MLNGREMDMAKELAREIVIVEREKEIATKMKERERRRQANQESWESLGRVIRNAQNAYINGFIKPINNAKKAMRKGYLG